MNKRPKRPKGFGSSPYYNHTPEDIPYSKAMKWLKKGLKGDISSQFKYTNYCRNLWNECSELENPTMIHERDYVPMDCCLCGKHMPSIHDTHNPAPITPETTAKQALDNHLPYRCCTECNREVTDKRVLNHTGSQFSVPFFDFFNQYDPLDSTKKLSRTKNYSFTDLIFDKEENS